MDKQLMIRKHVAVFWAQIVCAAEAFSIDSPSLAQDGALLQR